MLAGQCTLTHKQGLASSGHNRNSTSSYTRSCHPPLIRVEFSNFQEYKLPINKIKMEAPKAWTEKILSCSNIKPCVWGANVRRTSHYWSWLNMAGITNAVEWGILAFTFNSPQQYSEDTLPPKASLWGCSHNPPLPGGSPLMRTPTHQSLCVFRQLLQSHKKSKNRTDGKVEKSQTWCI